jgi:squalene synthase HpnC
MAGILTESERLRAREHAENFPVALRLLPRDLREALHSVYAAARLIDDIGDAATGDRTARLLTLRADLARIWNSGEPDHPVLRALARTVRRHELPPEPFQQLVEANLRDQTVTRYPDFAALREYCALSADPVGRLVLALVDADTPVTVAYSDRICTALQVLEHCQDVGEDYRAGRVYLPQTDLRAHGVAEERLGAATTDPAVRRLVLAEVDRADALLRAGTPLVRELRGSARVAVAGFVAGGRATVRALRAADGDVLAATVRPRRAVTAMAALGLLAGSLRGARA